MHRRNLLRAATAGASFSLLSAHSQGQAGKLLRIGAITSPNSLDPQFHNMPTNNQAVAQIFDTLVQEGPDGQLQPWLATAWKVVNDRTWEFTLRSGVVFHDGTPFEPEDVAFSIDRIPKVPNSPGSFEAFVRTVADVQVVNRNTLRITTKAPNPFLDRDMASVFILSRKIHADARTADFTTGKLAIGTGMYRYAGFVTGNQLELAANQRYWGTARGWSKVTIRYIPDSSARVAALLANDVDLIDGVPLQDLPRLSAQPELALFSAPSANSVYLFPDTSHEKLPFGADRAGTPLAGNPLKDVRVRKALRLALDRKTIVDRVFEGRGIAADQFAPTPAAARLPGLAPIPQDIAQARQLLAAAGYPDGFKLTIHGPRGFFANDAALLQVIGQAWSRIGVVTSVEALPPAVFFTQATNREYAVFMSTYGSTNSTDLLRQVALSKEAGPGAGPFNRQHYANATVDKNTLEALQTMAEAPRTRLTRQALAALEEDVGVIPVIYLHHTWAGRKSLVRYQPGNAFGHTNATFAHTA